MKTKLILSSIISTQLAFSHLALSQTTVVDCGEKLSYSKTPAASLVSSYIQSQKERYSELQGHLKEANRLKLEVEKQATTTETIGKITKYVGIVEIIGSLLFNSRTSSLDILDGALDVAQGDHLIAKAKSLKLEADINLKNMTIFLMNEEKSLNDLIQKHNKQECISPEEYLQFVSSYKKQAVDRITILENFLKESKKRVEKIKMQRNLKVGAKSVGLGASLIILYWGVQLATSKTIGIFQLVGYPLILGGGSGVVGLAAGIYSDINASEESINQILAVADNRLKELAQIKSLLEQKK